MGEPESRQDAYTLIEVILVIGLLVVMASLATPNLIREIESRRLPESSNQMRALLTLTRANAMYDGKRYRIRFAMEDEIDAEGTQRQPIVEREDDPFREPGVFNRVQDYWIRGETLLRNVWCAEVRLGRPTLERIDDEELIDEDLEEHLEAEAEDYEQGFPPLIIETDGMTEWVTFVLTDAPPETEEDELEEHRRIEVIMDGLTGLIWLQRPFYEEEIDLFKEHDWPPVLRRDFTRMQPLTEEDVLEIQETRVRR